MTKSSPRRRLGEGTMRIISLVPRGANQVQALFKNRDAVEMQGVAKMDAQGYLTSIVYLAEQVDSQGDIASATVVKGYCHDFIANMEGSGIDVMHDGMPVGIDRAQVCENFIVQKSDERFHNITDDSDNPVKSADAWATVIKIHDPVLKAPYANGDWVGVSMFGSAIVEPLTKTNPTTTPQETPEMDETKMAELLNKFGEDLGEKIVTGLAKALKPEEKVEKNEKPKIKFEGDPLNAEDLSKHADKVMQASCDLNTAEGLATWQAYVAKKEDSKLSESELLQKQIDALQVRLDKADSASNADPVDGKPVAKGGTIQDKLARGRERAATLKKSGVL